MGKRKKYKVFKNGKCLGEFYASDIYKMLGIRSRNLCNYVATEALYKGCYMFKKGDTPSSYTPEELEFMEQWDKYRKLLNPNAKKGKENE